MAQYLIQDGSNCIFMASPELMTRSDMRPYSFGEEKQAPKPIEPAITYTVKDAPAEASPKVEIEKTFDIKDATTETISMDEIKAELEAIDDPEEMIAHVLAKYSLKLTKTMKKSTMIERTIQAVKDWKGVS